MMRYYHTSYNNHTHSRINLRRALLLAAVIADFFAFYTIADIVIAGAIYLIQMLALFALSTALRAYATTLLITYDYKFLGDLLIITRSNTFKGRTALTLGPSDDISFVSADNLINNARIIDFSAGASNAKILKINGKYYKLALDEYMTALIKTYLIRERHND